MEILSIVTTEIIKKLIGKAFDNIKVDISSNGNNPLVKKNIKDLPESIENHAIELIKWASTIPLIGYNNAEQTDTKTIELLNIF